MRMVDWKKVRDDFPVTRDKVYLISAGMSPLPNQVLARVAAEYGKLNSCGDIHWDKDIDDHLGLRRRLCSRLGASGDDVAMMMNTSTVMSVIALSLRGVHGEGVGLVSVQDEFPSTTVPYEYQGVRMKYVKPESARYPVDAILAELDDGTVGVVTSYVQYSTGFRQDLERLGGELKRLGKLFIVNATQGFPLFPIDVRRMRIDALSASLNKWGFAGHTGAMFYTSQEFRDKYPSPIAGWLSVDTRGKSFIHTAKGEPIKLHTSAQRYMLGSTSFESVNPLSTALDYLEGIGLDKIEARIMELGDRLIEGLRGIGVEIVSPVANKKERSAIITLSVGARGEECCRYLEGRGIYTSPRAGNVRTSLNIFNDESDISRLIEALKAFLSL